MATTRQSRTPGAGTAYALLATAVLIFGVNWPIMKMGLDHARPLWYAVLRVSAAVVVTFAAAAALGRLRLPPRRDWPVVLSVGVAGVGVQLILVFTALQYIPAGRSSVLVWTASLWTVPLARLALRERLSPGGWAGLVVGIGGLVLLFEPWRFAWSDGHVLLGHGLLIAAAIDQAAVIVHTRYHRWEGSPMEALPWQMLTAAAVLLVAAPVWGGAPRISWS
jgi:drug/metabolite transporter (DMT)-like permease